MPKKDRRYDTPGKGHAVVNCQYNTCVDCDRRERAYGRDCAVCGWNPEVSEARRAKLRAQYQTIYKEWQRRSDEFRKMREAVGLS